MGCNCKNAQKIKDANEGLVEVNLFEKGFYSFKKILLLLFAVCLSIVVTPIVIVVIIYTMVFKGSGKVTIPNKLLNMLK